MRGRSSKGKTPDCQFGVVSSNPTVRTNHGDHHNGFRKSDQFDCCQHAFELCGCFHHKSFGGLPFQHSHTILVYGSGIVYLFCFGNGQRQEIQGMVGEKQEMTDIRKELEKAMDAVEMAEQAFKDVTRESTGQWTTEKAEEAMNAMIARNTAEAQLNYLKKKLRKSCILPAGSYYIGDPCYAIQEKSQNLWLDFLEKTVESDEFSGVHYYDGKPLFIHNTAYGDGGFRLQGPGVDQSLYVDAGLLCAMPVSLIEDETVIQHDYIMIMTFEDDFECSYENGVFKFGHLECDTDPVFDSESDDDWGTTGA